MDLWEFSGSFSGFLPWWGLVGQYNRQRLWWNLSLLWAGYVRVWLPSYVSCRKNNFGWAQVFYDCWISLYVIFWPTEYFPSEDEMGIKRNVVQFHPGARFSLSVTFPESTSPRSSTHHPK